MTKTIQLAIIGIVVFSALILVGCNTQNTDNLLDNQINTTEPSEQYPQNLTSDNNSSEQIIFSAQELWDQKELLIDTRVIVEGEIKNVVACTEMACDCCNDCSGSQALNVDDYYYLYIRGQSEEKGSRGTYKGSPVGCGGGECDISCYPFEDGKTYSIAGIMRMDTYESISTIDYYLELLDFEEI